MTITNTTISDLVPSEKALGNRVDFILQAKNELVTSGLAATGPEVVAVASGGPRKASIPFLNPLDATNVNISTDDITVAGSVGKLNADEFTVLRHDQNWAWGTADLTRMVTQYAAEGGIQAGIAQYWATRFQKTAYSSIVGVKAHIDAVIAAGAVEDAPEADVTKATDYSILVSGSTSTDFAMKSVFTSAATAEDHADMFDTLILHPIQYAALQAADTNSFQSPSQTGSHFETYRGYKVLRSTAFGVNLVTLCKQGGLAFGSGVPAGLVPFEIERITNGGTGAGGNVLHSRQSFVCHVQGTDYVGAVAPDLTGLENASNWSLKADPKQFGFRFIKVKTPA